MDLAFCLTYSHFTAELLGNVRILELIRSSSVAIILVQSFVFFFVFFTTHIELRRQCIPHGQNVHEKVIFSLVMLSSLCVRMLSCMCHYVTVVNVLGIAKDNSFN